MVSIGEFSRLVAKALRLYDKLGLLVPAHVDAETGYRWYAGAYRAVQDRGSRMPEELSLIGFDGEPWTTLVRPGLTVVEQPMYDLGTRAGCQLLDRTADRGKPRCPTTWSCAPSSCPAAPPCPATEPRELKRRLPAPGRGPPFARGP